MSALLPPSNISTSASSASLSREGIMDQLRAAFVSVTDSAPSSVVLTEATKLRDDLGLDSFAALELVFELEELVGVRISQEAASSFQTVGDVVTYVAAQVSAAPGKPAESPGRAGAP
jgi:acyl carrier protein